MYVLSCAHVFVTPWTVAHQAPLSMGFSRQEYWSGLPFPTLGDLSDPGIQPVSLVSPALAGGFFTTEPPRKPKGGWTGRQTGGETRDHQRQYLPSCLPHRRGTCRPRKPGSSRGGRIRDSGFLATVVFTTTGSQAAAAMRAAFCPLTRRGARGSSP